MQKTEINHKIVGYKTMPILESEPCPKCGKKFHSVYESTNERVLNNHIAMHKRQEQLFVFVN